MAVQGTELTWPKSHMSKIIQLGIKPVHTASQTTVFHKLPVLRGSQCSHFGCPIATGILVNNKRKIQKLSLATT